MFIEMYGLVLMNHHVNLLARNDISHIICFVDE